jgi:5-formyltetrahydrofolate cyclo-ligase
MRGVEQQKKELRRCVLQVLKNTQQDRTSQSEEICKQVIQHSRFIEARSVAIFASMPHEVCTKEMIRQSLRMNKRVFLPRVVEGGKRIKMLQVFVEDDDERMQVNHWGIPEPPEEEQRELDDKGLDLIILPGVAFDRNLNRLGYGKGYYDRLISSFKEKRPYLLGIGFKEQLVEQVPCDEFDQKLDEIIIH